MSLTSYRAAPPRVKGCSGLSCFGLWVHGLDHIDPALGRKRDRRPFGPPVGCLVCEEDLFVFGRPGGDLLSQVLRHSTIGAEAFDGRVRDGIGSGHFARATRPAKDKQISHKLGPDFSSEISGLGDFRSKNGFSIDAIFSGMGVD